jgi:hypothetical protein
MTDKLEVAMHNFLDEFVVKAERQKLPYNDFQGQLRSYRGQWIPIEPLKNTVIGWILLKLSKHTKNYTIDNKYKYFDKYALRYSKI